MLNPYGLVCGGLMLLITVLMIFSCLMGKIADRELARKEEVENILLHIYRQLGELNVVTDLPNTDIPPTALINRALDVKSAVLTYLAVHICHESSRLGIIGIFSFFSPLFMLGNMASAIFKGTEDCDSARLELESAIQEFNSALSHYAYRIGFKTFQRVEGIPVLRKLSQTYVA